MLRSRLARVRYVYVLYVTRRKSAKILKVARVEEEYVETSSYKHFACRTATYRSFYQDKL